MKWLAILFALLIAGAAVAQVSAGEPFACKNARICMNICDAEGFDSWFYDQRARVCTCN